MGLGGEQGAGCLTFTADRRGTGCSSFINSLARATVAESVEPRERVQGGEVERDLFVNSLTEINLYILSFLTLLWGKRVRSESPHVRHQGMPER